MSYEDKNKNLNEDILNKIKVSVFIQEKNNAKTKRKTEREMVETIRKIIQTEVDKDDN